MGERDRVRVIDAAEAAFCRTAVRGLPSAAARGAGVTRSLVHRLFGTGENLAVAVVARAAAGQRAAAPFDVVVDPVSARAALAVLLRHQYADGDLFLHAWAWLLSVGRNAAAHDPVRGAAVEAEAVGWVLLGDALAAGPLPGGDGRCAR